MQILLHAGKSFCLYNKESAPKRPCVIVASECKVAKILRRIFVHKFLQVGQKNPPNRKSTGHKPQRTVLCGDVAQGLPIWRIGFYTVVWRTRGQKSRVPLSESGARPFWKRKSFFCWEYQYEYEGERGRAQGSSTLPRKFRGITSSGCRRPPRKRRGHPRAGPQ